MKFDKERFLRSPFINEWKGDAHRFIKIMKPDISDDIIDHQLNKCIMHYIKISSVKLNDSYKNREEKSNLLSLADWIITHKPITTEHGTLYKRDESEGEKNPNADTLADLYALRKEYKKKAIQYASELGFDSFEFKFYNRLQLDVKIAMNSFYGASGLKTSQFYALDVALSITG